MKLNMNRSELAAAAKHAAQIAPSNSALKVLECTLLEIDPQQRSLTLTATNMEITLKQHLALLNLESEEGSVAINARLFAAMLDKLDGETVSLTLKKGDQLLLESGDAAYLVSALPGREFPHMEIPFPGDTVKVCNIPGMVQRTAFAVSDNTTMPLLSCLHLRFTKDGLRLVGSDGNCIITAMGDKQSTGDISFLVPATSMEKLAKLCADKDTFSVGTTGKQLVFLKDGFAFSARILEGSYADTDRIIGTLKPAFTVLTDAGELRNAVLSADLPGSGNRLTMGFYGDRVQLMSSGEAGNANIALEVIPLTGTPRGEYCYAGRALGKSLRSLSGSVTLGIAQGGMLTLSTEDAFYVQNSMRLKADAGKKAA